LTVLEKVDSLHYKVLVIFVLFSIFCPLYATGAQFENGPTRIGSALNIYRGGIVAATRGRFYSKQDIFTGPNNIESGVTVWDTRTSFGLYWGMLDHLEIGVLPIISQKNHVNDPEIDVPGDVLFYLKLGSLGALDSKYKIALQLDALFPTGATHNIPLNPYSAGSIGFGGKGIFSMNSNRENPTIGLAWDVNLGYFNHNDKGLKVTESPEDTLSITTSSQQLTYGTAAHWNGTRFGLFAELFGSLFLQSPPSHAFSFENSLYVSPGFSFQFNSYIRVESSIDYLLIGRDDKTDYFVDGVELVQKPWATLSNYPDWRFNLGLNFRLKQGTPPVVREKSAKEKAKVQSVDGKTDIKNEKKSKREKERDIKALEERLKKQSKKPTSETEEQRLERMLRGRERMETLLKKLREELQVEEEARQKLLEETRQKEEAAKKKAEELKLQAEEAKKKAEELKQKELDSQEGVEEPPGNSDQPPQGVDESNGNSDQPRQGVNESPVNSDQPPQDVDESPGNSDQPEQNADESQENPEQLDENAKESLSNTAQPEQTNGEAQSDDVGTQPSTEEPDADAVDQQQQVEEQHVDGEETQEGAGGESQQNGEESDNTEKE
jgi:hypothetical protein